MVSMEDLTERELQILGLIAEGLTTDQIAEELSFTRSTIASDIKEIFWKLELNDETKNRRVMATRIYLEHVHDEHMRAVRAALTKTEAEDKAC